MVQHALDHFISNAHLAKTGCERASQVMSADIENPIVAWSHTHATLCPSWRDAISDLLQNRTTTSQPLNTGREVGREQILSWPGSTIKVLNQLGLDLTTPQVGNLALLSGLTEEKRTRILRHAQRGAHRRHQARHPARAQTEA